MKRRSLFQSVTAIAVAVSIEVFGFRESVAAPVQTAEPKEAEIKYSSIRHVQSRSWVEGLKEVDGKLVGDPIVVTVYRVAPADHYHPSEEYPEFRSIAEAEKWAGVKPETINPKLITDSHPKAPMPVFPEPPDLSTFPRLEPQPENVLHSRLPLKYPDNERFV